MALASSAENPQPLRTVVGAVKDWVERLGSVWVEGQIIEMRRRHDRPTQFLTLRDRLADVSVSLTASVATLDAAGPLSEGTTVTAHIRPTVWSTNGRLTFDCLELRPSGEGRLLAQLQQRRNMLQAEGLFSAERKLRLPFLPRGIGLITGAGSAAERDVVETIRRRWPAAHVAIRHALMQGTNSAADLMTAVHVLDQDASVDVIIIARGGGSLEDLLPYSDEGLVRAVAAARTPVISAIGHESDTPILDLVADVRASTPTDAAKRVVPDAADETHLIAEATGRLRRAVMAYLEREVTSLAVLLSRPVLKDPLGGFQVHVDQVATLRRNLHRAATQRLADERVQVEHALVRVRSLSPKATLERGYAILVSADGSAVSSTDDVAIGDDALAYVADGTITIQVRDVHPQRPSSTSHPDRTT